MGEPTALGALHRFLSRRDASPAELLQMAGFLGVHGPVRRAVDVVRAG
jgi:hypothetical protein